jgi:hypothetical protein
MDLENRPAQELNARADAGSFSNAGSLADLEAEVHRRRQNRFVVSRRKWLLNALAGVFLVLILSAVGFSTYKFFNSRWVRQPADFFATQQINIDLADLGSDIATLPIENSQTASQFGLNGDLAVGGNLSLSQKGVEDLAQDLVNILDLQTNFPGVAQFGNVNVAGTVGAAAFVGGGSQLTDLNAANISSGNLANARLNPDVSLLGQSLSVAQIQPNIVSSVNSLTNAAGNIDLAGAGGISISTVGGVVQIDSAAIGSGVSQIVVGSGLTGGGTVSPVSVAFDGTNTIQGNTFNGASQLAQLDGSALLSTLDGSLLTNFNATALASGTIDNSRLSANIVYRDADTNVLAPSSDSTSAFSVRNSSGATDVINVDTDNENVSIGYPAATVNGYRLNINGDINVEPPISTLLIDGVQICGALTCAIQDGNTNYIQNSTTLQTGANIAVQSAGFSTTTMRIKTLAGQTSRIIDAKDSSQSTKLLVRNILSGEVIGYGDFTIQSDSTAAMLMQNTSLANDVLRVDTTNNRVGVGQLAGSLPNYTLDVNGDTNIATGSSMRIDGAAICTSTGCSSDGTATNYINNQTTTQTANLNVQSANGADVTAVVMGAVAQSANIISIENSSTAMMQISATGDVLQKTTTNSTSGFTVNDSSANEVLGVSTTGSTVNIGDGGLTTKLGVTASSTSVGQIIDNSGTGQSLQIKKSGTDVVTIADTGDTTVQPSVNTTTAMTVANATGGSILQAGTGYTSTDSTPSLVFNGANIGEIGSWTTNSTNMNKPLRDAGYVYANGYIYRIGGTQQPDRYTYTLDSEVASAPVNADGSVGSWTDIGDLNDGVSWSLRAGLGATYINGAIYTVGGARFNNDVNNHHNGSSFAMVRPGGSLSSWTQVNWLNSCCVSQRSEAPLVNDGYGNMYYIGGSYNYYVGPVSGIYTETVRGNLVTSYGSWNHNTNISALPAIRAGHSAVIANGYLYVLGGYSGGGGSSVQSTVWYAKLNGSGGAGSWSTANSLPKTLTYHCNGVSNGYLYVWGGHDGVDATSDIYYAKLNSDGSLGSWQESSSNMPAATYSSGCAVINGRLYSFGGVTTGWTTTSAVYYAEIGKVRLNANIDLIGLDSSSLAGAGGDAGTSMFNGSDHGSNLFAGSIYATGDLQSTGLTQMTGGLSVLDKFSVEGDSLIQTSNYEDRSFVVDANDGTRIFTLDMYRRKVGVNLTGSSNNISAKLHVSGGTASQNLMQVTDTTATSSNVMTIADGGATTFKNQTDSTAALAVQNTAAATIFSVDTTNTQVVVGDSSTAVNIKFTQNSSTRSAITRDFVCTATEAAYDVVEFSAADTVARTTTANSNRVAGVVVSKPSTTVCTTALYGVVQVYFGANANPTSIGDPVITSATAGAAQATTTPNAGALLGNSLGNKDGSNRVWVRLRRD